MSSGAQTKVDPECIAKYNDELKLGKKLKFIIYKLNDKFNEVVIDKVSSSEGKTPEEVHDEFVAALPEEDCRYAVYDFEYDGGEGKRNKLFFVFWASDNAKVKSKMVYASSKESLRRGLAGIGQEIQATDFSEVDHKVFLEKSGVKQQKNY